MTEIYINIHDKSTRPTFSKINNTEYIGEYIGDIKNVNKYLHKNEKHYYFHASSLSKLKNHK